MFSLMQPARGQSVDRPPAHTPTPASLAAPIDTLKPSAAEARADWPPDVRLPDEKEDDEC